MTRSQSRPKPASTLLVIVTSALLLGAGCFGSKTQRCSWGAVCPSNTVCDEERQICVFPGQVEACTGKDAGVTCSFPGMPGGAFQCLEGACLPGENCGDFILDDYELCDDGNTISGDGCSSDCQSTEICGNDYLDDAVGEQCDDGNLRSHDGCSSHCTDERAAWRQVGTDLVLGRSLLAIVRDSQRDRLVLFGGRQGSTVFNDTWEYNGQRWRRIETATAPPARQGHIMAFDSARDRVVLHGGSDATGIFTDTWEYDGVDWLETTPSISPPARLVAAAAYDESRGVVVLYGGLSDDFMPQAFDDTWEYDGNQWTEVFPASVPPARGGHAMTYDSINQHVVLYGAANMGFIGELWAYQGTQWTQLPGTAPPGQRDGAKLVHDPSRNRLVLHGGASLAGPNSETWEYDGADWTDVTPINPPGPRLFFGLVYAGSGHTLLFGGELSVLGDTEYFSDSYRWDGASWTQASQEIPMREAAGMVFDADRGRVVLLTEDASSLGDVTWELDGVSWTLVGTNGNPGVRQGPALAYDSWRRVVVLFGGELQNIEQADTWEYDGVDWVETTPTVSPAHRSHHAMTFDPERGVVVMQGGRSGTEPQADTWEYDGVAWRETTPGASPPARQDHAMTYDTHQQRVVLHGGYYKISGSTVLYNDTWEYDGLGWLDVTLPAPPPPRYSHGLIYDSRRGRLVLFGGSGEQGTLTDTWESAGMGWVEVETYSLAPSLTGFSPLAYDSWRGVAVCFRLETWEYSPRSAVPDETCEPGIDADGDGLTNCDDPDCAARPYCL